MKKIVVMMLTFPLYGMQWSFEQKYTGSLFAGDTIHKEVLRQETVRAGLEEKDMSLWSDDTGIIQWNSIPLSLKKALLGRYYDNQYALYQKGCNKKGWQQGSINSLLAFVGQQSSEKYSNQPVIHTIRKYMPCLCLLKDIHNYLPSDIADILIKNCFPHSKIMDFYVSHYKKIGSQQTQQGFLSSLAIDKQYIASAGNSGVIKIWKWENIVKQEPSLVVEFKAHSHRVNQLAYTSHFLISSCCRDKRISFWKKNNNTLAYSSGITYVDNFFIKDESLFSGGRNNLVAWQIQDKNILLRPEYSKKTDMFLTQNLINIDHKIVCAGRDSIFSNQLNICVWDPIYNQYTCYENAHHGVAIRSLVKLKKHTFASGATDNTVKMWQLQINGMTLLDTLSLDSSVCAMIAINKKKHLIVSTSKNGVYMVGVNAKGFKKMTPFPVLSSAVCTVFKRYNNILIGGFRNGCINIYSYPPTLNET